MRKIPYNFINIGCNGIENNMKKRGAPLKKEVKEFVLEEEDVLFSLLDFDVSKKHFFSFASIVFSLAIGLSMVNSIQKQGNVLGIWFVGIAFVFALLVVKVMVIKRLRQENQKLNVENILKRSLALYLNTLVITFVFLFAVWISKKQVLLVREIAFMWSLAVAFASVTLHMR